MATIKRVQSGARGDAAGFGPLVGEEMGQQFSLLLQRAVDLLQMSSASLSVASPAGCVGPVAATDALSSSLEVLQINSRQGCSHDCCLSGETVAVECLATWAHRWPDFVDAATESGINSVWSEPMRIDGVLWGIMTFYSSRTMAFNPLDVAIAEAFSKIATQALVTGTAIKNSDAAGAHLQQAMVSRVAIEQAKGIVAAHFETETDAAFDLIRHYARRTQRRLNDVAKDVVAGRVAPGDIAPGDIAPRTVTDPGSK